MVTGTGCGAGSENWMPERSIRVGPPSDSWRTLMFSMNRAATISICRGRYPRPECLRDPSSMRQQIAQTLGSGLRSGSMGSPSWGRGAMVATSQPLAVEAALWALDEGGTAMDAAIASDAVLGLTQPMSTGVGGDLFCLVDDGREVTGFNGSGAAPAALALDVCREPGAWNDRSPLTVTVPGAVDGWARLSERYGRLGLSRVLEPARRLAEEGFPLGTASAATWRAEDKRMRAESPLPRQPGAGQRVTNPDLAAALADIADGGPQAHYGGRWGKAAAA